MPLAPDDGASVACNDTFEFSYDMLSDEPENPPPVDPSLPSEAVVLGTLTATDEDSEDIHSWSMDLTDNFMIIESTGELIYIDIPTVGQKYEFMAYATDGHNEWDQAWVSADIYGNISPEFDGFIPSEQTPDDPMSDMYDPMYYMIPLPSMSEPSYNFNNNIDNFEFDLPHNFENGIIGTLDADDENEDDVLTWSIDDNSGYFEVNETNGDLTYLGGAPSTTQKFEFYAHVNDNTGTNNATDIAFVTVKRLPNTRPEFDGEEKEVDILGDQVTIYEEDGTSEIYTIPRGNGDDPNTNQSGASDPTPYTAQYYFYGTMDTFEFDVPHSSTGGIFGTLHAHDNEGDALTWTINDTSGYFEVDANTGELSYLGGAPTGESFRFYAKVKDSSSAVNYTDAAFVTVNRKVNIAPEFEGEEKLVKIVGDEITIYEDDGTSETYNGSGDDTNDPSSGSVANAQQAMFFFQGDKDVFEFPIPANSLEDDGVYIGSAPAKDANGDPLTYTSENSYLHFWNNNGAGKEYDIYYYGYDLELGKNRFKIEVSDGKATDDAIVVVNVTNDPPVAIDDWYFVPRTDPRDGSFSINANHGVLENDHDPDGDELTAHYQDPSWYPVYPGPNHHVDLSADGSFSFSTFKFGIDSFKYYASDETSESNIATVSVVRKPVDLQIEDMNGEFVPEENEDDPGAFIRLNNDDDNDNGVEDEHDSGFIDDDLMRLQITSPTSISGLGLNSPAINGRFKLKTQGVALRIWYNQDKSIPDGKESAQITNSDNLDFNGTNIELWVEGYGAVERDETIRLVWEDTAGTTGVPQFSVLDEITVHVTSATPPMFDDDDTVGIFDEDFTGKSVIAVLPFTEPDGDEVTSSWIIDQSIWETRVQDINNIRNTIRVELTDNNTVEIRWTEPPYIVSESLRRFLDDVTIHVTVADKDGSDTITVNMFQCVNLTAFRPETDGLLYRYHTVPELEEEFTIIGESYIGGAGIRVNGDDDTESGENDLVKVEIRISEMDGVIHKLRRSNSNIRVWGNKFKTEEILVNEHEIDIATSQEVWVENHSGGVASLELDVISNGNTVCSDKVDFFPLTSTIIIFTGEFEEPPFDPAPTGLGMATLAISLQDLGYDVHLFAEPDGFGFQSDSHDFALSEVESAFENRMVNQVAIIGYSHGGGSTYWLSNALAQSETDYTLTYT